MTDWRYQEPRNDEESAELLRQGAAAFLGEVLGLSDRPDNLATDLSPIKRDSNAAIYTIQLESSVGPAAFLVYAYQLRERGGDGHTGKELFDTGLETLQQAARHATPGPRAVAHAESDDYGYILATTPGTYRALTGGHEAAASQPGEAGVPSAREARRLRGDAAHELLGTLKIANTQATEWLAAARASDRSGGASLEDGSLEFTEDETELALFLLDNESIGNLLRALNVLVSTAQMQASVALQDSPGPPEERDFPP